MDGFSAHAPVPWRTALERALYGPAGFYRQPAGPAGSFRTSVHASPLFTEAILVLLDRVDAALGRPAQLDFVDVGAGRGELVRGVRAAAPASMAGRLRLHAVELAERPPDLAPGIAWSDTLPDDIVGLVVANEWLDNVPFDVVETDDEGDPALVLVTPGTGAESRGDAPAPAELAWLEQWWPMQPGSRAETGITRDQAWAGVIARMRAGLAVAIDYATDRASRAAGAYPGGTVTAYRAGRQVPPVPDGSCDITAAVALDACAAAATGLTTGALLTSQREALRALLPDQSAGTGGAPVADLLARLQRAGELAELRDPAGLGGFSWLVQSVGRVDLRACLGAR